MHTAKAELSMDVAICLSGQLRSLIFPVVQRRLNDTLLNPLRADTYLVASPEWTRAANLKLGNILQRPSYDAAAPARISQVNVTRIRSALPSIRGAIIADDSEMLELVSSWIAGAPTHIGHGSVHRDVGNALVDPRERCEKNSSRFTAQWQVELCHTRVIHAIRLRLCLALIEDGEARCSGGEWRIV